METSFKGIRAKEFTLDVWKWEGVIIIGGTPDQYAQIAEKLTEEKIEVNDSDAGRCLVKRGTVWLIWATKNDPCVLAHEALHVAAGVLEARGLKWSADSEEAFTYTMESILRAAAKVNGWRPVSRILADSDGD